MDELMGEDMTVKCAFCDGPVNPFDEGVWKEVVGWVHGPRKDSMTMREDTGRFSHNACVEKARKGQPADQPDLFGEEKIPGLAWKNGDPIADLELVNAAFEVIDEYHARVCIGERDGRCNCP